MEFIKNYIKYLAEVVRLFHQLQITYLHEVNKHDIIGHTCRERWKQDSIFPIYSILGRNLG